MSPSAWPACFEMLLNCGFFFIPPFPSFPFGIVTLEFSNRFLLKLRPECVNVLFEKCVNCHNIIIHGPIAGVEELNFPPSDHVVRWRRVRCIDLQSRAIFSRSVYWRVVELSLLLLYRVCVVGKDSWAIRLYSLALPSVVTVS